MNTSTHTHTQPSGRRARKAGLRHTTLRKAVVYGVLTSFLATSSLPSYAALTQLSTAPLASTPSAQVKPNIMFLLDTSGSMAWDYLPDNVNDSLGSTKIGYKNFRCNLIYYNPALNYTPPKKPDGTNFPDATFTGAFSNGFQNYPGAASTIVNLSTSFKADLATSNVDTPQAAYYYRYVGTQTLVPSTTGACRDSDPNSTGTYGTNIAATGGGNWVKVQVSATSHVDLNPLSPNYLLSDGFDERQNFANWHAYYRTRILAMKSAGSRAFNQLTDSFRVGLVTINPDYNQSGTNLGSLQASRYLAIGDFNTAQKDAWYAKLFTQNVSGATPLREALARVGRHYAGKTDGINSGMTPDPVQYSCQQNFTLLTTDGFWNGNAGQTIDGLAIGQQDGNLGTTPRPMWDGGVTGSTVVTDKGNLYSYATCTSTQVQVTTTQLYYFSQQLQETHTQRYYFPQHTERCSNNSSPCTGTWSNTTSFTYAGTSPFTCSGRQCRVKPADDPPPAFTAPAYAGWTAGVCPSSGSGIRYVCNTGAATAAAPVTGSCPANAGGKTYTCTGTPASVPAFPAAPTDPTTVGYQAASSTSCPAVPANFTYTCGTSTTKRTTVTLLAAGSACPSPANGGSTVSCANVSAAGQKIRYATTTYTTTTSTSGGVSVGTPTTTTSTAVAVDLTGICYANGTGTLPSLPNPNPQRPVPPGTPPAPPGGCSAWPCTTTSTTASGGSANSLADVAQYYYNTDLRPTMENNVPSTGQGPEDDKAPWQHMTTFTLGLGLSGNRTFLSDYKTATTGDFADIRSGVKGWPLPVADTATAIDDLWHAAVNGRGQYFSAADPDSVVSGLQTALSNVTARVASSAAAATSNLEPVAGDNFAYTAKYTTQKWTGELEAHQIDLNNGAVLPTVIWSAQALLDPRVKNACDNRTIYLFHAGAADNRVDFTWDTQKCDAAGVFTGAPEAGVLDATEKGYFSSTNTALLSQWATMTDGTAGTANQRGAAPGANLVNFLRGQKGKEGYVTDNIDTLYRSREHALGDIVSAQPVYVKAPFASYSETTNPGYNAYKTGAAASRTQMVYVAANDGMLHGFDAVTGSEAWAFIPSSVLPDLYKLADANYANTHVYSVDGTPSVGDVRDSTTGAWKTILVAGLNGGGKGYYAIDVTVPAAPKGLWEFNWSSTCRVPTILAIPMAAGAKSDCHLGYTFNNPVITKLANGRWVVMVTSGYNNVSGNAGDGQGYLYVLDAITGDIIYKISTNTGDATTPSGLNHILNWVDDTLVDNKTLRVYGADLLGNVWRFDVNDTILPAGIEATLIGTAKDPGGTPQPISTRPELAEVGGSPMVFVATGKLLGAGDITNTQVHSIWGIRDPLTATTAYADLRAAMKPMSMTVVGSGITATRTIACTGTTTQCGSTNGWVADLPDSGERVNVDMKLQLGTIVVASNVPQNTACNIGGFSWLNFLNFATGGAVSNSPGQAVSQRLSDSLAVGLNIVRLPGGQTVVITTTSDAKQTTIGAPFDVPSPTGKRISWREISQ